MTTRSIEGFVKVLGYRLFFRRFIAIERKKGVVLCLHGGPGMTHDYILPLADLSQYGYDIIFMINLDVVNLNILRI